VQEALEDLALDATVVRGRCLSYGEGITYWPLAEMVRDAVGPEAFDRPGSTNDAIAALLPEDPARIEVAARIAQLIGASSDMAVPAEETGWAVRRFLEGLARSRPLVIVLDDLQWAEPSLLDLVDQVTDLSRDAPILVLCMARPELLDLRPDWGGGKLHSSTITLEPLSAEETARLVENLLGGGRLEGSASRRILDAAEGNPLFVEETLAMLIDEGLLRRVDNHWTAAGDLSDVSVPPTIQALLAARLDRLEAADRAVLGRASVVGQVFYLGAVRDLAPEHEGGLTLRHLQQLIRRDLIRPDASDLPGQEAFRFQHSLLRDAAYQMLPKEVRAELHERFADWLADAASSVDVDEFAGYHLERAHAYRVELGPEDERSRALAERAAERLSAAGTRASNRADLPAARKLLARATALRGPGDPRLVWDLIALGWVLLDSERAIEASAAFAQAHETARASGDERAEAHAQLGRWFSDWLIDPVKGTARVAESLDRLIPRFEARCDDRGLAVAYLCRSQIPWTLCLFERAREDSSLALKHARAASDETFERASAVFRLMSGLLGPADVRQTRADLADLQAQAIRFPSLRVQIGIGEAAIAAMLGQFEEARRLLREAHEASFEMFGETRTGLLEWSWRIEMYAADPKAAAACGQHLYDVLSERGDLAHSSTAAGELAISDLELGRLEDARRSATECRDTSGSDDVVNQVIWRRVEARLLADEGEIDEAVSLIREAVAWAERTDMLLEQAETAFDEAEVCRIAGRSDEARSALRRARDAAERKGATVLVERADRRLAELGG
jgi:tetratricopeptide (TPR) repeat protein